MRRNTLLFGGILGAASIALVLLRVFRAPAVRSGLQGKVEVLKVGRPPDALDAPSLVGEHRAVRNENHQPSENALTVLVVDEDSRPVPGVEVFVAQERTNARRLGRTATDGELSTPPLEAPFDLVARGPAIQTREMRVELATSLVRIVVRRGASLAGRVVRAGSGEAPPAPARVVAWPNAWRFAPRELARRVQASDPRALATTTDAEGYFELGGLDPDTPYAVLALTPGWCLWPPAVLKSSPDNVLGMDCILGVRALVREPGGAPLELPPLRTYGKRVPLGETEMRGARLVPLPNPIAELFGSERRAESGDPTCLELLFACPRELSVLGPIPYELDLPGYERGSVDLWALPTDHGIPEQVVEAWPLGEARRDLHLEFRGVPPLATTRLAVIGKLGLITLVDAEGGRVYVDLPDLSVQSLTLEGVPASLRFDGVHLGVLPDGNLPCRRENAAGSTEDEPELWIVDASALRAARVDLRLPDDSPYLGPASFLLSPTEEEEEAGGELVFFERAPYVYLFREDAEPFVLALEPEGFPLDPSERLRAGDDAPLRGALAWH